MHVSVLLRREGFHLRLFRVKVVGFAKSDYVGCGEGKLPTKKERRTAKNDRTAVVIDGEPS